VFQSLLGRAEHLLFQADLQALANTTWAIAKLQVGDTRLAKLVAVELDRTHLKDVKHQEIANITWAFGVMKCLDIPTVSTLALVFVQDLPGAST